MRRKWREGGLLRFRLADALLTEFPDETRRALEASRVLVIESRPIWEAAAHEFLGWSRSFPKKVEGEEAPRAGVRVKWAIFSPGIEHDVERIPAELEFVPGWEPSESIDLEARPHPDFTEGDLAELRAAASLEERQAIKARVRERSPF